jgi:hypothetical protein
VSAPARPPGLAWLLVLTLAAGCAAPPAAVEEPRRAPGSERMARRLALLAADARPRQNSFMNRERLAGLRQLEPPAEPRARADYELRLATELLRAGHSEEAAERLAALADRAREVAGGPAPGFLGQVRSLLATAYLRLGEQENCLVAHTSDSCLLPIRDAGVHRLQRGSRAAMDVLAGALRADPEDLTSRWLYNLAAMTVGEYPEGVPPEWLVPPEVFASGHDVGRFVDVAPGTGLATVGLAGGVAVEDFDGDGYLDLMVSSWGLRDPLRLFLERRDGSFEERSAEAGLDGLAGGLNLVHADYDNDGDADVLVLRGAWLGPGGRHPNSLLENLGVGPNGSVSSGDVAFEDVTEAAGLLDFHPTQTAAWGDYDNDGWLDLFVGNESVPGDRNPCKLYRNLGPGEDGEVTFAEVSAAAGVAAAGYVKGVAWGDVDNDGWLDLYVSTLFGPNFLFHNQGASGTATFVEVAGRASVEGPVHGFPTWFFDYDNDGWLDLFVGDYASSYVETLPTGVVADLLGLPTDADRSRLYRNLGAGEPAFADVSAAAGVDRVLLAMGANFGDLDNDGFPDFYVGTGAPDLRTLVPNRMFRGDGRGGFQDVTTSGGFGHLQKGHAVAFADFDNDGDQDVFAVLGGAFSGDVYQNALFENPGHGNRWITLRLEGVTANRSAIGARVRVDLATPGGGRSVFATVGTGGSFGSASLQQEIGLGDATAVRGVEVRWPGSGRQVFGPLPMDRVFRLREGDDEPVVVELERLRLRRGAPHRHGPP